MSPPADLIVGAHWNSVLDLDWVRDGASQTASATYGTPTIVVGGKFNSALELGNPANPDGAEWTGAGLIDAMVQTGCVSFWLKTGYTGAPGVQQNIYFSNVSGSFANRVSVWHSATGFLQCYINNSTSGLIAALSNSWSPTAGTWYHIELNFDVTAGASRVFVDGTQLGATSTGTGTRSGTAARMIIGGTNVAPGTNNDFVVDELLIYDQAQHTGSFTPPSTEEDLEYSSFRHTLAASTLLPGGIGTDLWWWLSEPHVSTGQPLLNPSFEDPDGDVTARPEHWGFHVKAYAWDYMPCGGPYVFTESYEAGFLDNEDFLDAFGPGDLEDMLWGTELEHVETYESEWQDNEDAVDEWPTAEQHLFDLAGDEVEDYEEEWSSRHTKKDERTVPTDPILTGAAPTETRTRLNEIKSAWNAHIGDATKHTSADTTNVITSPNATDEASTVVLVNELWIDVWVHINDSGLAWHRPYWDTPQTQPTTTKYPAADYGDAADLGNWLVIATNLHFSWLDNAGPKAIEYLVSLDEYNPATDTLFQLAWPHGWSNDSGIAERYETHWRDNQDFLGSLGPSDVELMEFTKDGGTEPVETYEEQLTMNVVLSTGGEGTPLLIDPTGSITVEMTGYGGSSVYEVQTITGSSTTWVTRATIDSATPSPARVILGTTYTAVRIRTQTWGTGDTPTATAQWSEL